MRKIILYIATSLDGFIADKNGSVAWLKGDGSDEKNMGSYPNFIESVDTVVLGYNTYHQIITELAVDNWPYKGKMSYVITSKNLSDKEDIKFSSNLIGLINELKNQEGKDIWICGGASIANQLLKENLIDRLSIAIIPTILGDGTRLFETGLPETKLKLISTQNYNGITDLVYEKDNSL